MAVVPKRYIGYNKEHQVVYRTSLAADANNSINPNTIEAKIKEVYGTRDYYVELIQKALRDLVDDAEQAVIVNGTTLGPKIEEFIKALDRFKKAEKLSLTTLKYKAKVKHDTIQIQNNQSKKQECKNYSDTIVSVVEAS